MWLLDEHAPHTIITNVIATLTDSISTEKFFTISERVSYSGCCPKCGGVAGITRSQSKAFAYIGLLRETLFFFLMVILMLVRALHSLYPCYVYACQVDIEHFHFPSM